MHRDDGRLVPRVPRKGIAIHGVVTAALMLALACSCSGITARPPERFVDKGACPFECCTYGDWRARRAVSLVAEPRAGSAPVGTIARGAKVRAITGEVQTSAGKLIVREAHGPFEVGDEVWVYTYLGEGYFKIWHRGVFSQADLEVGAGQLSEAGWFAVEREPVSDWWVQIEVSAGLSGWTQEVDAFSGQDSCS